MKKINLKKEEKEKTQQKTKQKTAQKVFSVNEIRHCHRQFLTVKLEIRIRFEILFEIRFELKLDRMSSIILMRRKLIVFTNKSKQTTQLFVYSALSVTYTPIIV